MLQTVVLEKLGPRLLTLYEVDHAEDGAKYEGDRRAFKRALEAMNDVIGVPHEPAPNRTNAPSRHNDASLNAPLLRGA